MKDSSLACVFMFYKGFNPIRHTSIQGLFLGGSLETLIPSSRLVAVFAEEPVRHLASISFEWQTGCSRGGGASGLCRLLAAPGLQPADVQWKPRWDFKL